MSNFRCVLKVLCFLPGNSAASKFYIKFRRRGITRKKAYNIINKAEAWASLCFTCLNTLYQVTCLYFVADRSRLPLFLLEIENKGIRSTSSSQSFSLDDLTLFPGIHFFISTQWIVYGLRFALNRKNVFCQQTKLQYSIWLLQWTVNFYLYGINLFGIVDNAWDK